MQYKNIYASASVFELLNSLELIFNYCQVSPTKVFE